MGMSRNGNGFFLSRYNSRNGNQNQGSGSGLGPDIVGLVGLVLKVVGLAFSG